MILIAESINIMSKTLGPAMREKNPGPIQEMAKAEAEAGADYLDINVGPARKGGDELMQWMVKTVQEVTDVPLSLDTTNPVAMEAGLKVCKSKALINSISLSRMDAELPFVMKYNADWIGLLWGRGGMPRDTDERAMIASELMMKAAEMGIPTEKIWFDPILTPIVNIESNHARYCMEFMSMLQDIAPGAKSGVGLSNVSNGAPAHLRSVINQTYLMMLMKHNLHSAIVDVFDKKLVEIGKGKRPELVSLVHRVMDGERPDLSSLAKEEADHVKTVRVITGETLYSHSWLEV